MTPAACFPPVGEEVCTCREEHGTHGAPYGLRLRATPEGLGTFLLWIRGTTACHCVLLVTLALVAWGGDEIPGHVGCEGHAAHPVTHVPYK